jgi:hypothetical protein
MPKARLADWHFLNEPQEAPMGNIFVSLSFFSGPTFSIEEELRLVRNPELVDRPQEMIDLAREVLEKLRRRENENVNDWSRKLADDLRDATD